MISEVSVEGFRSWMYDALCIFWIELHRLPFKQHEVSGPVRLDEVGNAVSSFAESVVFPYICCVTVSAFFPVAHLLSRCEVYSCEPEGAFVGILTGHD